MSTSCPFSHNNSNSHILSADMQCPMLNILHQFVPLNPPSSQKNVTVIILTFQKWAHAHIDRREA